MMFSTKCKHVNALSNCLNILKAFNSLVEKKEKQKRKKVVMKLLNKLAIFKQPS